jgi:transcription elongation factor
MTNSTSNNSTHITINSEECIDIQLVPKIIQNEVFHIPQHFVPQVVVGKGSYGMVISATDQSTNESVAIKVCFYC